MPKVSVVVPVYKVEAYIERCVRSLFEQTLDDIEYLFIDDASPDRSIGILLRILEEYPHRKEQVKIHHMERNSGQAAVRRWGIQHSSGEYIINCDSDDWVEKEAYEKLYNYATLNQSDIVFHDYFISDGTERKLIKLKIAGMSKDSIISAIISGEERGSIWNTLVKKCLFMDKRFHFPCNDMTEDSTMLIQLLWLTEKIDYIQLPYYNYFYNTDSISKSFTIVSCEKRHKDCYNNTKLIEQFLNEQCCTSFNEDLLIRKLLNMNLLLPAIYKFSCYLKWRNAYPNILSKLLKSKRLSRAVKGKIILAYCGLYPIYHFFKGYQFAK